MISPLDTALLAIVERLKAAAQRLASAPERTAENAHNRYSASSDPRRDMAFHQAGALEQICRNEAATLECAIKWLSAATREVSP